MVGSADVLQGAGAARHLGSCSDPAVGPPPVVPWAWGSELAGPCWHNPVPRAGLGPLKVASMP